MVENIIEGSPADKAGLKDDDRVIRVGKNNVEKLTHPQVVQVLRKSGNQVTMLVVDKVTYHHYRAMFVAYLFSCVNYYFICLINILIIKILLNNSFINVTILFSHISNVY